MQANGVRAHYLTAGSGSPLLLVHGAGYDAREWSRNFTSLCQRFTVFAPDLVGFGKSDKPRGVPYTYDYFAGFLRDFMDAVGVDRTSIVGHSMGGGAALAFALAFPHRLDRLVLVDSSGLGREMTPYGRAVTFLGAFLSLFSGRTLFHMITRAGGLTEQGIVLLDRLSEIEAPTLIVWGERDRICPVRHGHATHELLPGSELHVFSQCGHAPQREDHREFNRLALEFLCRGSEA